MQRRGFEVLYMVDPIDEYTMQNMQKFDGKYAMTNVGKEGLTLPGEKVDEDAEKEQAERFEPLTDYIKDTLGADKVDKVVLSKRLTTSPSAIVTASFGYTANMERIMRSV